MYNEWVTTTGYYYYYGNQIIRSGAVTGMPPPLPTKILFHAKR